MSTLYDTLYDVTISFRSGNLIIKVITQHYASDMKKALEKVCEEESVDLDILEEGSVTEATQLNRYGWRIETYDF